MPIEGYTPVQKRSERKKFVGIQALRGLAACMVVSHHATLVWSDKFAGGGRWWNGASGVDLFFVISGFVMTVSYAGEVGPSAARYLAGRFIRIAPLYWIATLIVLLKLLLEELHPGMGRATMPPVSSIWHSFFFIPYGSNMQPILSQGWTLSFEMFFYVLFAISLYLGIGTMRFMLPVLVTCAAMGIFRNDSWPAITDLFSPLLLEFLGGMAIGIASRRGNAMPRAISICLGVLGLACLVFLPLSLLPGARLIEWGAPAMLVVNAVVHLEQVPGVILAIGDTSYSLYLFHSFVITGVVMLCGRLPMFRNEWLVSAACLISSLALSLALYRFLEKPMTGALTRSLLPYLKARGECIPAPTSPITI